MNEERISPSEIDNLPKAEVEAPRGFSMVWLIPIVAGLIGIWLGVKTIMEEGPTVTITFSSGAGLEAGKTKIKYKAVQVGMVEDVQLIEDLSGVTVTAKFEKGAEPHLTENTKFWVVRPQIGLGGVSGLETLISGAYVAVDPRPGPLASEFKGLDAPPGVKASRAGSQYILQTEDLGGLQRGSPVFFRDITVGEIIGHELAEDGESVLIPIFINAPHDQLIRENTRFWKASGLDFSIGSEGVKVEMDSLAKLVAGGVAFETPFLKAGTSQHSPPETVFELYNNFASIGESSFKKKVPYMMHFRGSVRGLNVGAPVKFRGIKVGSVTDIRIKFDPDTNKIQIPVFIELEPERVAPTKKLAADYKEGEALAKMVERGLRAQLETGSLLTGQLFVELEFYPKQPRKKLIFGGKYPEIPTIPSTMDQFKQTASKFLDDLKKLPLDQIANELLGTIEGANRLVNSREVKQSIRSLNAILADMRKMTKHPDGSVVKLVADTDKTLIAARQALGTANPDSPLMADTQNLVKELSSAARSLRILADYLEQHPEALIHGKGGPGD